MVSKKELKQQSEAKMGKPAGYKHADSGVGERTKRGEPVPGQGAAPPFEIGEPSEPSGMSPEEKKQLQGEEPTFSGKPTPSPKSKL